MRAREFIIESAASIGRKYQHIEDLVFTNGSRGGLHAVERLRDMLERGGTIELKWDGSPVVYWGRDSNGRFMLIPKNAWQYLQNGKTTTSSGVSTIMKSPEDIKNFITQTGQVDPTQEKIRQQYANEMANLWNYFKKVSPDRGFIEGGLLFYPGTKSDGSSAMPQLNKDTLEYEFTPNITTFHIPKNSDLGRRIEKAKIMVAATGYYPNLGDTVESRYPNAEKLSTNDVIVQGTTYVEQPPQVDTQPLNRAEDFITKNATLIDQFLSGQPGLKKPGDVLYKFYNQKKRISGTKQEFRSWVTENLSPAQAQKILSNPGLDRVLDAVDLLIDAKMSLIQVLRSGVHGGIRQTKPEGYAQAYPDKKFPTGRDLPGQFVKFTDPETWVPRKD